MNTNLSKYIFLINKLKQNPDRIFTAYDDDIKDGIGLQTKQIGRMFETIESEFEDITQKKLGKKIGYCYKSKKALLKTSLEYQGEISAVIQTIKDYDEDIVQSLEQFTTNSFDIYHTVDQPLVFLKQIENSAVFKALKNSIIKKQLINIKLQDDKTIDNLLCIKFVYTDNNWFVAVVDSFEHISLHLITQIKKTSISNIKKTINKHKLQIIMQKLIHIQNSSTDTNKPTQTARLKALPNIASFFDKDAKKYFKSQKFIKKQNDNSVIFTIDYSSDDELLTFVQRWIPNIIVQEPLSLRQESDKRINKYIANQIYEAT